MNWTYYDPKIIKRVADQLLTTEGDVLYLIAIGDSPTIDQYHYVEQCQLRGLGEDGRNDKEENW